MLKTIGSDMEIFAKNVNGHVAMCDKIGGTKYQPLQIPSLPKGFMIQEDNVALEFNIPVCHSGREFVNSFRTMRKYLTPFLKDMGLVLSTEAAVSFDTKELAHPNALVFGCEPDYNAWSKKENPKPKAKNVNLRTCGGHIHIGSDIDMVQGVKNCDLFLGIPSVILDDSPASLMRKELYGRAGAMRPKPYGWEYRTLSNYWMFSDELVAYIYQQVALLCEFSTPLSQKEGNIIQHCINTNNKEEAIDIMKKYDIVLPT